MVITHWYITPFRYCVAYYKDAWDLGLTYSHREFWFNEGF